jgi:dTDP-4-dehydrorhamnose reductase
VTNAGEPATWFDVAQQVFVRVGIVSLLSPCTSEEYPTPARRPSYSVLSTERLEATLPHALPSWRNALSRFLTELGAPTVNPEQEEALRT